MTEKVKVAVRVRPLNRREIDLGTKVIVDMEPTQTVLFHPSQAITPIIKDSDNPPSSHAGNKRAPKIFAFDHCFWSMEDNNPKFSSQEQVFDCLGQDILERAFEGYNACIFAYGQTGSGKSYTMMGSQQSRGIIPRLCDTLFERIMEESKEHVSSKVEVSYMEIYNEKVHDLLDPKGGRQNLRVREHNILGPYVDGLSQLVVESYEDIETLMVEGNKSRTVAATNMNSESSRSHAVFNIILTQTMVDVTTGVTGEKVSKMSLVDLAGSERAQKTGAVGERLKEGSNINKSLTTLGLVISSLADQAAGKSKNKFVPYRDSVLTWLLKDNLGGNSKTVMVATLSPAADNYEETLSTLRYADRAKRIVNHAVVNEDPNARIIRELREEVEELKTQLNMAQNKVSDEPACIEERLEESEKLFKDMTKTWEEKLQETERIHQDRHASLEKMGISVQTSGIKVEHGRYFLVNLNSDPSLNELLVYYLKDHTLVGRPDAPTEQDIQLSGLGIMPEHCIVDVENSEVFVTPFENARTCVNGSSINSKTKVKHGDRIIWGNNHFFRINCPNANSPSAEQPEQKVDYDFAQQELLMNEMPNDPIQEAIQAIEQQHEDDKQEALEKQRQMYERQMQMLRIQLMSPSTPSQPFVPFPPFDFSKMTSPGSKIHQQWAQERDKLFKQSLAKLREEVLKANCLVREANVLAQEMGKRTEFSVTLQIPAANLSPNRKRGAFMSEPAILVKRKDRVNQVWSMEKFENKIIDMREMYEERKEKGLPMMVEEIEPEPIVDTSVLYWDSGPPMKGDPFYESQENHNLIGVANVFLEALFFDVKLDYQIPIISQQGEVAGRLHVELSRVEGSFPMDRVGGESETNGDSVSRNSLDEIADSEQNTSAANNHIVCRVSIKEAKGLPPALSNFVFCHYTFWGHGEPIVVAPYIDPNCPSSGRPLNDSFKHNSVSFKFDHEQDFKVSVNEEFIEHATEGALSIEVWGHRSSGFSPQAGFELENVQAKSRSLLDRWGELIRKLEMWVEIHELNDQGEYQPVEVIPKTEALTGGVYQLRQGHSRRILVRVSPVQNSGTLPIICETITSISVGAILTRNKLQKALDSYQEEDLRKVQVKWSEALMKRREYLDEQIQKIINKPDKTDADAERERSLIDQWVCLTEERNAVLVPAAGSGIPGALADWSPPLGMEQHMPVLFLDLNADDMTTPNAKEGLQAAGIDSTLPKEYGAKFFNLPIVKYCEKDVCAVASWDSSIHDSSSLNRLTPSNERVYMIVKAVVRLSHPASMELVVRKRVGLNIYKKQALMEKLKKRISKADVLMSTGVTYEVVSNIPKASEDLEDRESLAQMAANQNEAQITADGETYIEKYIKGVSAVESILTLDKLRQEVAIKELLSAQGRPLRKTSSVPNIHGAASMPNISYGLYRNNSVMNMLRSDSYCRGLDEQLRSESVADLSRSDIGGANGHRRSSSNELKEDIDKAVNPALINLASPKNTISPQPTKFVKPMRTLLEEQHVRETKPLLRHEESDSADEFDSPKHLPKKHTSQLNALSSDDEFQEFETYRPEEPPSGDREDASVHQTGAPQSSKLTSDSRADSMTHSSTTESLNDIQAAKSFTPSMTSSGYGSQAVSTLTLSSEDSGSIRSMSVEETPELEATSGSGAGEKSPNIPEQQQTEQQRRGDVVNDNANSSEKTPVANLINLELDSPRETVSPNDVISPTIKDLQEIDFSCNSVGAEEKKLETATGGQVTGETGVGRQNVGEAGMVRQNAPIRQTIVKDANGNDEMVDVYSESAMDELERLAPDEPQTAAPPKTDDTIVEGNELPESTESIDSVVVNESKLVAASVVVAQQPATHNVVIDASRRHSTTDAVVRRAKKDGKTRAEVRKSLNLDPRLANARKQEVWEKRQSMPENKLTKLAASATQKSGQRSSPLTASRSGDSLSVKQKKAELEGAIDGDMNNSSQHSLDSLDSERKSETHEGYISDGDDSMSMCSFGSRADLDRLHNTPIPSWIQVGESVLVTSSDGGPMKTGVVKFLGMTEFAAGQWVGLELDQREGKNDGSVKGVRYFKCRSRHGIFVRHDKLIMDKKRRRSKASQQSSSGSTLRRSNPNLSGSTQRLNDSGSIKRNGGKKK
ncbi:kinesin-like protein KIF13A isoform X2 [Tubulanus polymorphus]|uniref:kinesin-like protein KIF13A isoform X2 n=1 Tax=Tubulanus polymorphus TaxID=672921 RepID=UPI003DA3AF4E